MSTACQAARVPGRPHPGVIRQTQEAVFAGSLVAAWAAERPKVACRGPDLRGSGRRDQSSPRVAGLLALAARVARVTRGRSGWLEAAYPGPGQRGLLAVYCRAGLAG